jgi:hypothetical protein
MENILDGNKVTRTHRIIIEIILDNLNDGSTGIVAERRCPTVSVRLRGAVQTTGGKLISRANERRTGFDRIITWQISWTQPSNFEIWNDAESGVKEIRRSHNCCYEGCNQCPVQDD